MALINPLFELCLDNGLLWEDFCTSVHRTPESLTTIRAGIRKNIPRDLQARIEALYGWNSIEQDYQFWKTELDFFRDSDRPSIVREYTRMPREIAR